VATFDVKNFSPLRPAVPKSMAMPSPCAACSIRHLSICAALEDSEVQDMAAITTTLEVGAGEPLIDEGQPAVHVFNVTSGAIKVYKLLVDGRRQMTGFIFPGDFLGLANDETYAYSAEAVIASTVCRFPRRKLEAVLTKYPKMERRLLGVASHELAAAQEQMLLLGRKNAREKIASFLLMLSRRAAQRGLPADPIFVPMSRNDIGDYLGLTTETVSRTFSDLKSKGIIVLLPAGKVQLARRAQLEDFADGA